MQFLARGVVFFLVVATLWYFRHMGETEKEEERSRGEAIRSSLIFAAISTPIFLLVSHLW